MDSSRHTSQFFAKLKAAKELRFTFLSDDRGIRQLPRWVKSPKQITDGHLAGLAEACGAMLATLDEHIPPRPAMSVSRASQVRIRSRRWYYHTTMPREKVTLTLDSDYLQELRRRLRADPLQSASWLGQRTEVVYESDHRWFLCPLRVFCDVGSRHGAGALHAHRTSIRGG